jgi:thiamine biosynthesis lipoprotein
LIVLALATLGAVSAVAPHGTQAGSLAVHEFTLIHMGMPVRLRFYAPAGDTVALAATTAFARIASLDAMMSDYRPNSEVRRLGASNGTWIATSPDLFAVLARAVDIARVTDGAFDPTVGPLVTLWRDARTSRQLPHRDTLAAARACWLAAHSTRPVQSRGTPRAPRDAARSRRHRQGLHPPASARGDGASRRDARPRRSWRRHCGGDAPPDRGGWRIDVSGSDATFAARAARLTHASLATSGPTAQFVEIGGVQYSHVIDPRTGLGLTNHVTARVIAHDGATADALATALTIVAAKDVPRIQAQLPDVSMSIQR